MNFKVFLLVDFFIVFSKFLLNIFKQNGATLKVASTLRIFYSLSIFLIYLDFITSELFIIQSVHFPDTYDLNNKNEALNDLNQPKSIDEIIDLINKSRKRDLTDWIFAEHYDPKTLVQILQQTSFTHPHVDSYYNRRDDSLMLIFSNPYDETTLSNHQEWAIKLHSNVGFRNYLEKIYDMIIDWTRDEEAKYQASLVAKEVDKFWAQSLESIPKESASRSTSPSKKRTPSPKDKKKSLVNQNVAISPTNADPDYINTNFVSHNSLKAWKMEQDKLGEVSGKIPKVKSPRAKSGSKSKSKSPEVKKDAAKRKNSKSPRSRDGSAKTKKTSPQRDSKTKEQAEKPPSPKAQKANQPFIGYQVGNNMVYVKSHLSHMFPYSGALIKTERVSLKTESNLFVTSSVIKDGNTYSIHLVDPKDNDKADTDKNTSYTCFTSVFKDGLSLSITTPISYQGDTSFFRIIYPAKSNGHSNLKIVQQNVSADSNFVPPKLSPCKNSTSLQSTKCFRKSSKLNCTIGKDQIWVIQSLYQLIHLAEQFLDTQESI
ncbi:sperm-associated antigen 17-like isoform X4 [Brachionus plicatilis]|uniref:Sperm-associated antigen 17-like isoform X4 n=1 Tax=Brachionus plicatilis TaxID=10195 RepID=A0A3M7SGL7_BRAPC|nr:sperm-associated antigen 17-like isoform X4 [Brachionus plicatilis]